MLYQAKLPLKFWAEAVNTIVYFRNRSPTSSLKGKTPFEYWFREKPDIELACVWMHVLCSHS